MAEPITETKYHALARETSIEGIPNQLNLTASCVRDVIYHSHPSRSTDDLIVNNVFTDILLPLDQHLYSKLLGPTNTEMSRLGPGVSNVLSRERYQ